MVDWCQEVIYDMGVTKSLTVSPDFIGCVEK